MSGSWVTASIEGDSSEVAVRIGAAHTLLAGDRQSANGLTPLDLLLSSLGACTAITLNAHAASRHWSLEVLEVDLEINSRQNSTCITRLLSLKGSLDPGQREELLAAAEQTPVTLLLATGVRIRTELA